jgi:signal transduction histidine kinase
MSLPMRVSPIAASGWAGVLLMGAVHLRVRRRLVLVARASHEIRGPLCAARLGLEALAAEPARVVAIDLELRRAGRALDDLLAAPSGARAPDRPELVDVAELAQAHAPAWSAVAATHGAGLLVLDAEAPAPVVADPLRVAQACTNLVRNAAEHGGGLVRVRVRMAGELVRFEVADDGPGLPAPVAVLLASARSRQGRRGHGLAVAAEIAARHGGRVAAAPGARVVLELPAATLAIVAPRRAVAPPPIVA